MPNEHPSAVSGAFGRPFNEQVAFFRAKLGNLVPTQAWDDMLAAEHDTGFMVAGAAKADLLTDLAAAVDKAITEGRGIEDFRKDFRAIVARHGWTGWAGEGSVRGEAWRVKTILRTNAYTSYSAGRYAQLAADDFPLWVYRHGDSEHPRPFHLLLNGVVLPPSHPLWRKYYPPSAWGCSCYVLGARSPAAARRLGGDPDKELPGAWNSVDPRTGAPPGIDRGWDYAPGATVSDAVRAIAPKVRHWDYAIAKAFMEDLPASRADALADAYRALPTTADDAATFAKRVLEPEPLPLEPVRTLGRLRADQAAAAGRIAGDDLAGFDYSIDKAAVLHVRREHGIAAAEERRGQQAVTAADYAMLLRVVNETPAVTDAGLSWSSKQPLVETALRIGDLEYVARWEVRRGRRTLALETFFIRRRRPG